MAGNRNKMLTELILRDKGICHICSKQVLVNANPNHAMAPTKDHLIPSSLGGPTRLENLKLAHVKCNQLRGNKDLSHLQETIKCPKCRFLTKLGHNCINCGYHWEWIQEELNVRS